MPGLLAEREEVLSTFDEGQELAEQHKARLLEAVKAAIVTVACERGEVHANDLGFVQLPDEHKNLRGIAFRVLIQSGRIVPTGERRKATAPESHGRRSDVYRLAGVAAATPTDSSQQVVSHGGSDSGQDGPEVVSAGGPSLPPAEPLHPVEEASPIQTTKPVEGMGVPETLFQLDEVRPSTAHYQDEAA